MRDIQHEGEPQVTIEDFWGYLRFLLWWYPL